MPKAGGALVVANHSGGMFTPDVLIFAPAFYDKFGFDRPVYTLAHYGVFIANVGDWLRRACVIEASRENAAKALRDGAVVLVFPGGDYDSYRPTLTENVIDFGGRTGYVRTAIESGVPIVPMVSIGAQETQLFLARGDSIARRLGLKKARIEILPISIGFPFGLSASHRMCRCRRRSLPECSSRSTSRRSSVRTRISARLIFTCARSCRRRLTNWRANVGSRSWVNRRRSRAPSRCGPV
jgi:1-acyl-sn-glycerol-3-phosphate acyltransferase